MKLIEAGLVKEVKAKAEMPVWRRDEQNGQSYALKLTVAGAEAIALNPDDDAAHAADEERSRKEQSSTLAQPARTAAGVFAAPSAQALATPRPPRVGTKLAQVIEVLRATEGAAIAELSEAMGWLPHTTRAILTGLRKRGYALTLDRSGGRGSAYRIAVEENAAHMGTGPMVIEPPTSALIDGTSEPSASPVRPASARALRRFGSSGTSRAA
jgi:hypothetical protein